MITAGLDSHRAFGYSGAGEFKITVDQLEFEDLRKYMEVSHGRKQDE